VTAITKDVITARTMIQSDQAVMDNSAFDATPPDAVPPVAVLADAAVAVTAEAADKALADRLAAALIAPAEALKAIAVSGGFGVIKVAVRAAKEESASAEAVAYMLVKMSVVMYVDVTVEKRMM
jgi:hypothetical protein